MRNKMQVAETILEQLGGARRLGIMVNARDFVAITRGLQFKFSGSRKANTARVELTPRDTYTLTLYKVTNKGLDIKDVASEEMYFDQMVDYIESVTGLALHF